MPSKIVLKDGTEIENGLISISSEKQILISVPGDDLVPFIVLFGDELKTKELICFSSIFEDIYQGYTKIESANVDAISGKVRVYMTGDHVHHECTPIVSDMYIPEGLIREDISDEQ